MRAVAISLVALACACGEDVHSVGLFGSGSASADDDDGGTSVSTGATTGAATTTDEPADASSHGSDTHQQIFDVGSDEGSSGTEYCSRVDILFVIDNSPSMGSFQEQLAFAFPTFIDAMWSALPDGTDLHVGITTTSFFTGSCSESTEGCMTAATPAEVLAHYTTPDQGSTGVNGEQGRLYEWDGQSFFAATVGADPWPLKIWFSEAAVSAGEVGCSFEMMSAGAAYPFHAANATANADFVRNDDAVLVIFVLTDEPDKSPEEVTAYVDLVMDAKSECGAECVITAGLVEMCIEDTPTDRLWQFLNAWPDPPTVGAIDDAAGYDDVIGAALAAAIGTKCDEIRPEG
jgi:hypothetical protein